jgi:large subunit ribosomal protein L37Ae
MAKRTVKVGITRKYGTRYGAALRKIIKKFELSQHARYYCDFCGKVGFFYLWRYERMEIEDFRLT